MNKNEFLMRLRKALASLPFEECQSAMKYYEEYFEEAGENREGDIIKELGSPEMLAATILGEYSASPTRTADAGSTSAYDGYKAAAYNYGSASGYGESSREQQQPWYRRAPLWVLVLLGILLCPIIIPLFGAGLSIIAAIFLMLISVVGIMASVGITAVGCGVSGIMIIVVGAMRLAFDPALGILTIGVGMLLAGLGVLIMIAAVWLCTKVIPVAFRFVIDGLRRIWSMWQRR